jgi:hypothetical protein
MNCCLVESWSTAGREAAPASVVGGTVDTCFCLLGATSCTCFCLLGAASKEQDQQIR